MIFEKQHHITEEILFNIKWSNRSLLD